MQVQTVGVWAKASVSVVVNSRGSVRVRFAGFVGMRRWNLAASAGTHIGQRPAVETSCADVTPRVQFPILFLENTRFYGGDFAQFLYKLAVPGGAYPDGVRVARVVELEHLRVHDMTWHD